MDDRREDAAALREALAHHIEASVAVARESGDHLAARALSRLAKEALSAPAGRMPALSAEAATHLESLRIWLRQRARC